MPRVTNQLGFTVHFDARRDLDWHRPGSSKSGWSPAAVQAGAASVMCSYNKVNGLWSCENASLQNGILRGQWGFQGFVACDWGAVHSPLDITRGVDLEMPGRELAFRSGPYFREALERAVENGSVPVSAIDQAVTRYETFDDLLGYCELSARPTT